MNARQAFNFADFSKINARDENDFADFGTTVSQGSFNGSTYTFRDNGSNVLGIAHLDTVQSAGFASLIKVKRERIILSPRLDDRLGVYIITRLLPRMGITCDWLLTTGEESGCSSAELFRTDKQYNWAFSFDRMGDDCVLYQYDHKALRRILRKAGFTVGLGTFSDLSSLDVGCSGINFGCGYYDNHSLTAYAKLSETFAMVDKFSRFYAKYSDTRLPFNPKSRYETMRGWRGYTPAYSHYGRNGYTESGYGYSERWEYDSGEQLDDWFRSKYDRSQSRRLDREYLDWYNGESDADIIENLADDTQRFEDNGQ